jgi:hypothetical protein
VKLGNDVKFGGVATVCTKASPSPPFPHITHPIYKPRHANHSPLIPKLSSSIQRTNMPRGNEQQTKVHYKGNEDDFIIFVESSEEVQKWKNDSSVPLAQVVNGWKVFVTHK